MEMPKMVVLLLNSMQYSRPKLGGTQYARREGVSPSYIIINVPLEWVFLLYSNKYQKQIKK